jgi:hypothetical protein
MPKRPRIRMPQYTLVSEGLSRRQSMATIRRRTNLSDSSINCINADLGVVLGKQTTPKEDRRIERRFRCLGRPSKRFIEESDLQRLKQLARMKPKVAELLI